MHILLVEDDAMLAEAVEGGLRQQGWAVDRAGDVSAARLALLDHGYGAVLLDLGLPRGSGLDVLRAMRGRYDATPVLIMTARDQLSERIHGLDAGADDYLVKPFRLAELLARVRACSRRAGTDRDRLEVGDLTVDVAARRATVAGVEVELRPKEFDLLVALAAEAGRVVARERLMGDVWERHWAGSTKTLDIHVWALRRKLDSPGGPSRITTVRGIGYRLERP